MEKIKNILVPGRTQDDETLYGQGQTSGTHKGLAGEGSHFDQARDIAGSEQSSAVPGSFPSDTADTHQHSGIGAGNTTAGPHSSNLANRVDPTVDSDRSRDTTGVGIGNSQQPGLGGTNTTGPHTSNLANRGDPTVNSDRARGTTGASLGSTQQSGLNSGNTTTGPHSSDLQNKLDPTVNSNLSQSQGTTGAGIEDQNAGLTSGTTSIGPHSSNIGNQSDSAFDDVPRNSSGGILNNQTSGVSPGNNTTSPHNSSILNRADPRVDSRNTGLGNHLGRDAAAVGAAGAVGEGVHHHREHGKDNLSSNTGNTGLGNTSSTNPSTGTSGYDNTTSNYPNNGSSDHGNPFASQQSSGHHYGRDAAALGTAGAVGEGIHHHNNERDNLGSTTHGTTSGTSGPHNTETANRLDPTVNTGGSGTLEDAHHHHKKHGGGAEEADDHHRQGGQYGTESSRASHVGRDTLAAGGAAGAVGLTEHEHNKHNQQAGASGLDGQTSNTSGPVHNSSLLNKLDPRVKNTSGAAVGDSNVGYTASDPNTSNYNTQLSHQGDRHLGRDAAIAGGVGGAGYEAEKHHHRKNDSGVAGVIPTTNNTTTSDARSSNLANREDPMVDSGNSKHHHLGRDAAIGAGGAGLAEEEHHRHNQTTTGQQSSTLPDRSLEGDHSKDHHYGRDAAVAGGVGGAAYEADKHHKHDKDLTAAEKEQKREHKHELKEEKREHKAAEKEHKHEEKEHHGLLSFLHRDKKDKDHSVHDTRGTEGSLEGNSADQAAHDGKYAAPGAAALGGAGAYEAEKHHGRHGTTHDNEVNKPLPTAPGNHGVGTGAGTQNALAGENTTSRQSQNFGARDAAAVGGAGALSHEGHHHAQGSIPLDEKPPGKDIGDKLHGVDRNRGVTGASGFPDQEGFGSGPTHHSGVGGQSSGVTGTHQQHHLGRDAAVGAGGVGLAEHEHRKHEGLTGNQHGTSSGLTGSNQGTMGPAQVAGEQKYDSMTGQQGQGGYAQLGQQSGLAGNQGQQSGLGAAEVAGERKYDSMTGQQGEQSGFVGNQGTSGLTGSEGRNRLHKDPPANHPAAQQGNLGNY